MRYCNGVFEGGGVRGIGHVGAACGLEAAGFRFMNLAGSSAGALAAALLAAGYRCRELKREVLSLDYSQFRGRSFIDYFGTVGKALSLLFTLGIYDTRYLEQWMKQMLETKGIRTFGDVEETGRRLFITATDLTDRRLLIFPQDAGVFGMEPEEFPVALAVRMSASIPVFFEPVRMEDRNGRIHLLADGGLLSNYPIWLLDDGASRADCPTFGFKFGDGKEPEPGTCVSCHSSPDLVQYLKSIVATCMDVIDNNYVSRGDQERVIWISPVVGSGDGKRTIRSTDFGIRTEESEALFENGCRAAEQFLDKWNFTRWKMQYRD